MRCVPAAVIYCPLELSLSKKKSTLRQKKANKRKQQTKSTANIASKSLEAVSRIMFLIMWATLHQHTDCVANSRKSLSNFLSVTENAATSADRFQAGLCPVAGREFTQLRQRHCMQLSLIVTRLMNCNSVLKFEVFCLNQTSVSKTRVELWLNQLTKGEEEAASFLSQKLLLK